MLRGGREAKGEGWRQRSKGRASEGTRLEDAGDEVRSGGWWGILVL